MFCLKSLIIFVSLLEVMSAQESHNITVEAESVEAESVEAESVEAEPVEASHQEKNNGTTKYLKWWDCGDTNSSVRWQEFRAEDPVRIEKLTIGAKYQILDEIRPGSYSKVEVWRVFNLFVVPIYVKIPCIGKFGSCHYDICRIMDRDNFCSFQRENNAGCGCPMTPKVVEGYEYKARIPTTKFTTFQQLYAQGQYQLRWTWYNPEGEKIACLEGRANVKLK